MTKEKVGETGRITVDLDTIFPAGYVLFFGENRYYQTRRGPRIILTESLSLASYFPTAEAAEVFVRSELLFVGLEIEICLVAWILLSWDGLTEVYWQGATYDSDERKAVRFLSYHDAKVYQREMCLRESGTIELHTFREKRFRLTAA